MQSMSSEDNFWDEFFQSGTLIECPDRFVIGAGKRIWTKHEAQGQVNFYFPDFFLRCDEPFFHHAETKEITKDKLSDVVISKAESFNSLIQWNDPDYEKYQLQYDNLYALLESGFLKKAVLYALKEAKINHVAIPAVLKAALHNKGHAHLYGFWDKKEGMIGATPEILFEKKSDGVLLEAIAGTKVNAPFTDKEIVEHQIVIDGIKEALKNLGTIHESPRRILAYGVLTHLMTPLKLEAEKAVPFLDLVQCLHPTPALGTYPKDAGLPWLKEVDAAIPRNRYGAPAGFVQGEKIGRCLVAIRNLQWKDGVATMAAGGGVTIESKKESEWEEILRKFNAIQRILSI